MSKIPFEQLVKRYPEVSFLKPLQYLGESNPASNKTYEEILEEFYNIPEIQDGISKYKDQDYSMSYVEVEKYKQILPKKFDKNNLKKLSLRERLFKSKAPETAKIAKTAGRADNDGR